MKLVKKLSLVAVLLVFTAVSFQAQSSNNSRKSVVTANVQQSTLTPGNLIYSTGSIATQFDVGSTYVNYHDLGGTLTAIDINGATTPIPPNAQPNKMIASGFGSDSNGLYYWEMHMEMDNIGIPVFRVDKTYIPCC